MLLFVCLCLVATPFPVSAVEDIAISLENDYLKYVISTRAETCISSTRRPVMDHCDQKDWRVIRPRHDRWLDNTMPRRLPAVVSNLEVAFGNTGVTALLKPIVKNHYWSSKSSRSKAGR